MTTIRWRLGRLGAWYIYRVRRYEEGGWLRFGYTALLDPFFLALNQWGGYFRLAPFWRLVRSHYRAWRRLARRSA